MDKDVCHASTEDLLGLYNPAGTWNRFSTEHRHRPNATSLQMSRILTVPSPAAGRREKGGGPRSVRSTLSHMVVLGHYIYALVVVRTEWELEAHRRVLNESESPFF